MTAADINSRPGPDYAAGPIIDNLPAGLQHQDERQNASGMDAHRGKTARASALPTARARRATPGPGSGPFTATRVPRMESRKAGLRLFCEMCRYPASLAVIGRSESRSCLNHEGASPLDDAYRKGHLSPLEDLSAAPCSFAELLHSEI